jgi:hypothetical protein
LLISIFLGILLRELGHSLLALEVRYDLNLVNDTSNLRERYGLRHRVTAQVGHEEHQWRIGRGVDGQPGEGQRGILQGQVLQAATGTARLDRRRGLAHVLLVDSKLVTEI